MLSFVSLLEWADLALISVAAEPIKQEFEFSDTQLGILMGFAFVLFRMAALIPIGRLADRWNRRNLLMLSLGVVSTATVAFGLARNFLQLLIARAATGAGTAGSSIAQVSMIVDLFPLRKRGLAMGVWGMGGTFGWSLGMAVGGAIAHAYSWRTPMLCFGIFGMAVTFILLFALREPERRDSTGQILSEADAPPIRRVLAFMLSQRSLIHTTVGFSLITTIDMLIVTWAVTYFIRIHGLDIAEAGGITGFALFVGGLPGTVFGGYLLDYLGRRDIRLGCPGIHVHLDKVR